MELKVELVENILKTLPIGYYLVGRTVEVSLDTTCETSYCMPDQNKIVIAYKNLEKACGKIEYTDIQALENDIRCLLYHELSHIILTPEISSYVMKVIYSGLLTDRGLDSEEKEISMFIKEAFDDVFVQESFGKIFNIFEDQRIETILGSYYMNVDFVSFRKRCLGFKPLVEFEDWLTEFFWTVRFSYGEKIFVDRVNEIIKKYSSISSSTRDIIYYYQDLINLLLDIVLKYYSPKTEETEESKDSKNPSDLSGDGECVDGDSKESTNENEEAKETEDSKSENDEESNDSKEKEESSIGDFSKDHEELNEKDLSKIKSLIKNTLNKLFKDIDAAYLTFKTSIDRLLCNSFNKKKLKATSINGYSGRLNVKNLLDPTKLDNYRWFNKKANDGINNTQFNKIKLNLYIDCSGSFWQSMPIINSLIRALIYLESQYKDFEFDVVKINDKIWLAKKNERFCKANGGNVLSKNIIDLYNKLQTKNVLNYNIVVFDGYCLTDSWDKKEEAKNMRAFNHAKTTIISDSSNKEIIKKYSPQSTNIITCDYANQLVENVIKTLTTLLR